MTTLSRSCRSPGPRTGGRRGASCRSARARPPGFPRSGRGRAGATARSTRKSQPRGGPRSSALGWRRESKCTRGRGRRVCNGEGVLRRRPRPAPASLQPEPRTQAARVGQESRARPAAYLVAGAQAGVAVRDQLPVQEADERVLRAGERGRRRREQHLQARHARSQPGSAGAGKAAERAIRHLRPRRTDDSGFFSPRVAAASPPAAKMETPRGGARLPEVALGAGAAARARPAGNPSAAL